MLPREQNILRSKRNAKGLIPVSALVANGIQVAIKHDFMIVGDSPIGFCSRFMDGNSWEQEQLHSGIPKVIGKLKARSIQCQRTHLSACL